MKIRLALVSCLLAVGVGAETAIKLPPPKPSAPDLIDGELIESCWKDAYRVPSLTLLGGGTPAEAVSVRLLADDSNLYVGFECYFSDYAAKAAEAANPPASFFMGDTAEVFLDLGASGIASQIAAGPSGRVVRSNLLGEEATAAVKLRQDHWTAEFRIPFSAVPVGDGARPGKLRLNVARGNTVRKEWSTWAPLQNSFHEPANFQEISGFQIDLDSLRKQQKARFGNRCGLEVPRWIFDVQPELQCVYSINDCATLEGCRLLAKLTGADGRTAAEREVKPVFFSNEISLPLANLSDGKYRLSVSLLDASGKTVDVRDQAIWKIPPKTSRQRDVYTIKNQCMYRNGEFFFPIFIWTWSKYVKQSDYNRDAQWYLDAQDAISRDIREHGFTTVLSATGQDFTDEDPADLEASGGISPWEAGVVRQCKKWGVKFEEKLRRLEKAGLNMIVISPYSASRKLSERNIDLLVRQMVRYRDYDNIMAWNIADETDGDVKGNLVRRMVAEAVDPSRPTFLTVINAMAENNRASSVLASDPYPIPNGPVTIVASWVDRLLAATANDPRQTQWIWLQHFGEEGVWTRPPTAAEIEVMTTLALNHGVKGIGYFTYTEEPRRKLGKRQDPEAWDYMRVRNARTTELAPMYCLGKRLELVRRGDLDVAVIEYEKSIFVSAVNVRNAPVKNAPVTKLVSGTGKVLYEERTVKTGAKGLTDDFGAYQSHIYRFEK